MISDEEFWGILETTLEIDNFIGGFAMEKVWWEELDDRQIDELKENGFNSYENKAPWAKMALLRMPRTDREYLTYSGRWDVDNFGAPVVHTIYRLRPDWVRPEQESKTEQGVSKHAQAVGQAVLDVLADGFNCTELWSEEVLIEQIRKFFEPSDIWDVTEMEGEVEALRGRV